VGKGSSQRAVTSGAARQRSRARFHSAEHARPAAMGRRPTRSHRKRAVVLVGMFSQCAALPSRHLQEPRAAMPGQPMASAATCRVTCRRHHRRRVRRSGRNPRGAGHCLRGS
jgi:hypothetical protein